MDIRGEFRNVVDRLRTTEYMTFAKVDLMRRKDDGGEAYKKIDNEKYLKQVVLYIHNNPIHHGFCETLLDYPWSSYLIDPSDTLAVKNRQVVLAWFGGKDEFETAHNKYTTIQAIKKYLED